MDPTVLRPEQWDQIASAMIHLYAFTGLAVTAAFAFLLAHAVLPSLIASRDAPEELGAYRRVLYPVSALALLATLYALARALLLALGVLQQFYPRWGY
ncbi:MAG TPA: hypothetical protein VFE37_26810 [Chloroflexota bacterium]|nr:hypothetical protein [Chloroflexota bacterium]